MTALEAALEDKSAREKQLVADLKKKGDTARQMLLAKDEELGVLRDKLRGAVEAATQLQLTAAAAVKSAAEHHSAPSPTLRAHSPSDGTVFSAEEVRLFFSHDFAELYLIEFFCIVSPHYCSCTHSKLLALDPLVLGKRVPIPTLSGPWTWPP